MAASITRSATVLALGLVASSSSGMRAGNAERGQQSSCSANELIAHVSAIAADSMAGRAPGSIGDRAARRYVISTLERYGVRPGAGQGFEQRVPLHRARERTTDVRLSNGTVLVTLPARAAIAQTVVRDSIVSMSGDLVWVGFGVDASGLGWSDYAGADVAGKIVVAMSGIPAGLRARIPYDGATFYETREHKEWAAHAHGARALILLADLRAIEGLRRRRWTYSSDAESARPAVTMTLDSSVVLSSLDVSADDRNGARPVTPAPLRVRLEATVRQTVEPVPSANIVGLIPGRTGRWAAITAHHDGLGIGTPDARGDSTYNGAQDNALGVAIALCVARAANRRADVGLVLILTAAEEQGRLGGHHWVTHPTVPRDSIRFALDLDALGVTGPTEDLLAYGSTTLTGSDGLRTAIESAGFRLSELRFQSSMHFSFDAAEFAGAGIPAVTLGQGTHLTGLSPQESFQALRGSRERYHAPSDEVGPDWEPRAVERYLSAAQAVTAALQRGVAPVLRPGGPHAAMAGTLLPDVGDTAYVLPYATGASYRVLQANHGPWGHSGHAAYAYDFALPLRTPITAARAGVVVDAVNRFEDGNRVPGEENVIVVRHADSTFARYYHLTRDGGRRAPGDTVAQGDTIALSGNTGASAGPHLHFDVTRGCYAWRCPTVPVRFVNARAEVLERGAAYEALRSRPPSAPGRSSGIR